MSNESNTPKTNKKKTSNTTKKVNTNNKNTTTKKKTTTPNKSNVSKKKTTANSAKSNKVTTTENTVVNQTKDTSTKVEKVNEVKTTSKVVEASVEETNKKQVLIKILDIFLWVVLIIWMLIVIIDYVKVRREKEPIFCIKEEVIQYEDGTVNSCTGIGYKVYEYNRESYSGIEFGPFWIKVRNDDSSK